MKQRFILYRRGETYYSEDTVTRFEHTSLLHAAASFPVRPDSIQNLHEIEIGDSSSLVVMPLRYYSSQGMIQYETCLF
jgi:hypothetical protein